MKKLIAILMLLVSSTVMAHNKVVVIPLGDGESPCLISGLNVECVAKGKIRIPIGLTASCIEDSWNNKTIKYTEVGERVVFEVVLTTEKPRINIALIGDIHDMDQMVFNSEVTSSVAPDYELAKGHSRSQACVGPVITQVNKFSASGSEWKLTPVFSSTATELTLDALVFERQ